MITAFPPEYVHQIYTDSQYYCDQSEQSLALILKYARLFRTEEYRTDSPANQKLYFKAVVQLISDSVQNYEQTTLLEKVLALASDTLNVPSSQLKAKVLSSDNPVQRDVVYLISPIGSNHSVLAVKVYRSESTAFLQELDGLNIHKDQQLALSQTVGLRGMGKTTLENSSGEPVAIFMVAYSAAPGEIISNYLKIPEVALPAFKKLGLALGELHSKEQGKKPVTEYVKTLNLNHQKMLKNFENYPKKEIPNGQPDAKIVEMYQSIDLDLLAQYVAYIKTMPPEEVLLGLVHGDAHFGNFLYDPETETLTMIDLGGVSQGIVGADFSNILERIRTAKISNEEKKVLKNSFIEGYIEGSGVPPSPQLIDWIKLAGALRVLGAHEWIDSYPPDVNKMVKAIIKRNYNILMTTLENFRKA